MRRRWWWSGEVEGALGEWCGDGICEVLVEVALWFTECMEGSV